MRKCKDCKYWKNYDTQYAEGAAPNPPEIHNGKLWASCQKAVDMYEEIYEGKEVDEEPDKEAPYEKGTFIFGDGFDESGGLTTREDFGCVCWEPK